MWTIPEAEQAPMTSVTERLAPERQSGNLDRALLTALVAGSEDAIISKTLDGIVTSWNPAAERLFGWTAEEMTGRSVLRLIPPPLQPEEEQILAKLRAGERIERYETTRLRSDGSQVDVSLTISPIRDAGGRIIGASKIVHDISERRRTEAALIALAEEGHALETLSQLGWSVASELDLGVIAQRITDAATELSGASFGAFFYNITAEDSQGSYWLHATTGIPHAKLADLPLLRTTDLFAPTFRGEGIIRSDDIRVDPRFANNGLVDWVPEGNVPIVSYLAVPAVSRNGEIVGGLFLGHPERAAFASRAERLVTAIASQAAIAIDTSRLVLALKDRETRLNLLLAERERIVLSERMCRGEAERLGQLKDEFLATLSHELRTPLNAVHGWTQILLRGPRTDDQNKALLVIDRNVRAQSQIIGDLLDMSRIISGKILLEVQAVQLHQVVQAAIDTVRQTAEARKIRISSLLDSTMGLVRGDPGRLQQVLWNLLTNAIKFTPAGGRVHVVLEKVGSQAEISVEDSGLGIRDDFLPFIFDRFRQADASTTRRFGGLGLGLSIVRNLVELHGGTVRVRSRGENLGSTFTVALPLSHVQPGRATDGPAGAGSAAMPLDSALPTLDGARILVVDDESDGRQLLVRMLGDHGALCIEAVSAADALAKLAQEPVDILLSDIGMPDHDGYELIARARAMDASRDTPLPAVAITAYARREDRERALLSGFNAHVVKPIEPSELVATIDALLRLTRPAV
jgi:PAS domain S-box-containing protein